MESRGTGVVIHSTRRSMLVGGQGQVPAALPPETDPIPTVQDAVRVPELVWKNFNY